MADQTRGNWSHRLEFLFSCIGVTVGLGNIWRFPYICYKNGGGAFLVPYFIFLLLIGAPVVFLQFTYGQYSNLGPGKVWDCCPLFRGIGYGMMILTAVVSLYYTVIISWTLYYFGMSFFPTIPWSTCDNSWNTAACYSRDDPYGNMTEYSNETTTTGYHDYVNTSLRKTSPEEFWEYSVLELTDGIHNLGSLRVELFLCLLATSVIVFMCLIRGIHTSGKVMYVAATIPYVFLLVLLIRGLTLPGSMNGLLFYLVPRWEELLKFSVWVDAGVQIMYSLSLGSSALTSLASHNKFHNNIYRDAVIITMMDAFTSWFAGCVIFVTLGYMAHKSNVPVGDVVDQGPGVAFMVYPEALATLELPQLWSALFFLMLFTVGLDSQIVHIQLLYTGLTDSWPRVFGQRRLMTIAGLTSICLLLGLVYVTQGGMYLVQLTDWYISSLSLFVLTGMEVTVLAWVYGADRLFDNLEAMLGHKPSRIWMVMWKFITPITCLVLWIVVIVQHKPVSYGTTAYPAWSIGVGWIIAFLPLIPIPASMVLAIQRQEGSLRERVRKSVQPMVSWKPAISSKLSNGEEGVHLNAHSDTGT